MTYPTDHDIRAALLARVEEYCRLTGQSRSAIGQRAINDRAFVYRLTEDRNFTISVYQRLMTWLDDHWPVGEPTQADPSHETKAVAP